MPEQHSTTAMGWLPAWADLQERPFESAGSGFSVGGGGGTEYVAAWPDPGAEQLMSRISSEPGARLTLVCADADTAAGLAPAGLSLAARSILLMAPAAELDVDAGLPDTSQVAQAPMETYDAVEITVFDRPVAKGRIQVRDGFAVVAITELPEGPEQEGFQRAMFAAMAEEAFLHGAEYLHMVVPPADAPRYEGSGWTIAGHLLTFEKQR